jgi:hypothetical protein
MDEKSAVTPTPNRGQNGGSDDESLMFEDDRLKAYHVSLEIKFDLEQCEVEVTSWGMDNFRLVGRDMFDLFERLPFEIATWFHHRYGVEVVVVPVHSTHHPKQRGVHDGYVVITVRSILAEARALADKLPE